MCVFKQMTLDTYLKILRLTITRKILVHDSHMLNYLTLGHIKTFDVSTSGHNATYRNIANKVTYHEQLIQSSKHFLVEMTCDVTQQTTQLSFKRCVPGPHTTHLPFCLGYGTTHMAPMFLWDISGCGLHYCCKCIAMFRIVSMPHFPWSE